MARLFILALVFILVITNAKAQQEQHLIKSIYFGGGSYYIDEQQVQELMQFLDSIPNIHQFKITVHSHTDNIGGVQYNEWLSSQRSYMTIQKLINYSLTEEMVEIKDFGQYNPVYDNNTMLGRLRNRRVDVIIWPLSL
jgi:OOP family OmpA-OmpF porin